MLLFSATLNHIPILHHPVSRSECALVASMILECGPKKTEKLLKQGDILSRRVGFTEVIGAWKFERNLDSSWRCGCDLRDGDVELESEIMDFMAKSEKPTMFPTKAEFIKAGRMDLVVAIKKKGGWYSLGWDEENVVDNVEETMDLDVEDFLRRVKNSKESYSSYDSFYYGYEAKDGFSSKVNPSRGNSNFMHSGALDRPPETGAEQAAGIEGILSRLDKQRNSDFGINLENSKYKTDAKRKNDREHRRFNVAKSDLGRNGSLRADFHRESIVNISDGNTRQNAEPESWRSWSSKRAGSRYADFEAAEINVSKDRGETDGEYYHDGIAVTTEEYSDDRDKYKVLSYSQIKTHLHHLESELTSALHSLRCKREEWISDKVTGSSCELQKLSDAWEFQENEFMSAQRRLRSIKAKLAIAEGKMALAAIDAQKKVEVNLRQIQGASKVIQLLRTTHIVWPNPASEVLLAGSFDGWTTQRKMEKSKTGIFSTCLMLFPGRYEIKFIVDGMWKVDPLRPIVTSGGYENNLFIVT